MPSEIRFEGRPSRAPVQQALIFSFFIPRGRLAAGDFPYCVTFLNRRRRNMKKFGRDSEQTLDCAHKSWYNFNLRGYSANFAMRM